MNWYVLFVRNGSEEQVVSHLKTLLDSKVHIPFVPIKEYPQKTNGMKTKGRKVCFPGGYVFLRSSSSAVDMMHIITPIINNMNEVYRLLHYGDNKMDIAMHDHERQSIERLLDDDFCIAASLGFYEGDQVRISSGALVGLESQIKKINKHNRTAIIEVPFLGETRMITLMLEVLEKV